MSYQPPRISAALGVFAVVLAGCANTGQRVIPTSANGAMVIEVSVGGGLAPAAARVGDSLPRIWISGDGRYLRQVVEVSSPPALAALEERRIPEAAVAGLLDDARAAGLFEDNPDYGKPLMADAAATRIVIVADGTRHEVLVSALGYPNRGLSDTETAARARLSAFLDMLQHPERIAGAGAPATYAPSAIAVFVLGAANASERSPAAIWPLRDPGTAGAPTEWPVPAARCLVVAGADAASVVSAAAGKDRSTPWRSGDSLWDIAFRPLLPDEQSCADVVGY